MRTRTRARFCLLPIMSLALSGIAQINTGTVVGTVRDPQNSAVPAATVSLTNTGTGDVRNAETNSLGEFVFPAVVPGGYTLKVVKQGFRPLERHGLALSSSQTLSVGTLALTLGGTTESVTVTAESAAEQTASSEGSAQIEAKQTEMTLARGRDVMS